eukprot:gene6174-10181_t
MWKLVFIIFFCKYFFTVNGQTSKIYGTGDNWFNALTGDGIGAFTDLTTPKELLLSNVIDISSGYSHTMALLNNGSVCTFGEGTYGKLGRENVQTTEHYMICIPTFAGNSKISAGSHHNLVLTTNNDTFSFGSNRYGQLGLKDNINKYVPNKISVVNENGTEEVITKISAGSFHSLLLTENHQIYSFGDTIDGQLGIGLFSDTGVSTPTKVPISNKIKEISAGGFHSILLDQSGNLLVAGYNAQGQLGSGDVYSRNLFIQLVSIGNVSSISAGAASSAVIMNSDIYTFGLGTYGTLGHGDRISKNVPTRIVGFSNISIAHVERYHLLVIDQNGTVFGSGFNGWGQLGLDDLIDRYSLSKLKTPKSFKVGVGKAGRSYFLTCNEKCSDHGYCSPETPEKCTCKDGYSGKFCNVKACPFPGPPVYCSDFGYCMNSTCVCDPGYVGETCETPVCAGINATQYDVCLGRGDCISPDKCECTVGYAGNNCEVHSCGNIHFNETNVCSSQGKCIAPNKCVCGQNYTGALCENALCYGVSASDFSVCSSRGKCLSPNNCSCNSGYFGETCQEFKCFGVNSKNSSVCSGRGECISSDFCYCYTGRGLECQYYNLNYFGLSDAALIVLAVGAPSVSLFACFISFLLFLPVIYLAYRMNMFSYLRYSGNMEEIEDRKIPQHDEVNNIIGIQPTYYQPQPANDREMRNISNENDGLQEVEIEASEYRVAEIDE